jgi:hypothetical protein
MYGKSSIKNPHIFFVSDTTKFVNTNTSSARIQWNNYVSDSGSDEPQVVIELIFLTKSSVWYHTNC